MRDREGQGPQLTPSSSSSSADDAAATAAAAGGGAGEGAGGGGGGGAGEGKKSKSFKGGWATGDGAWIRRTGRNGPGPHLTQHTHALGIDRPLAGMVKRTLVGDKDIKQLAKGMKGVFRRPSSSKSVGDLGLLKEIRRLAPTLTTSRIPFPPSPRPTHPHSPATRTAAATPAGATTSRRPAATTRRPR